MASFTATEVNFLYFLVGFYKIHRGLKVLGNMKSSMLRLTQLKLAHMLFKETLTCLAE